MRLYNTTTLQREEFEEEHEIKEALLRGYVPSVTTILDVINEGEYLTRWKIKNSLEHYIEKQDKDAALIYRDTKSADFGTVCHNLIEYHLKCELPDFSYKETHARCVKPLKEWVDENVDKAIFLEENFANSRLGYGGTVDMVLLLKTGEYMVGDLKVKKHSEKFPMHPTPKYKYQLSAYRNHFKDVLGIDEMTTCNFLLASPYGYDREPKLLVFPYYHKDYTEGFEAAKLLWYNNYLGE